MSNMGISGLGSGLDTESIVRQLMSVERRPLYNMKGKLSNLESIKKIWRTINTKLSALDNALQDMDTSSAALKLKATSSNEQLFTATASSSAVKASYNVEVRQLAAAHSLAYSFTPTDGSIDLTVDGKTITVATTASDTVETLRDNINNAVNTQKTADSTYVGVKAAVVDGKLTLQSEKTGTQYAITVAQKDSTGASITTMLTKQAEVTAQDAQVVIDGLTVQRSTNSFSDVINGITFNLQKAELGTTAQLTVDNDTKAATDAVNKFITAYNDLISYIDQQTNVSAEDNTEGSLKGDFNAREIMIRMREKLTGQISSSSSFTHLSQLGLSTDKAGKLSLDSAKWEKALVSDPQGVQEFFFSAVDSSPGVGDLIQGYVQSFTESGTGIIDSRDAVLESQMKYVKSQIESFENRLTLRESALRKQFLAMEKALSAMNNQSMWLAGQIAGLSTNLQGQ